ncbi:MAG: SufD family Fe-S cluster assembly protein [Oscillospiraceae bacterium]|jgi:Fe-S cluster assembly scaffold protein SufB|nr:SufD family Fe-S cluster assembly protein [Oscillospiraceae bacterium]
MPATLKNINALPVRTWRRLGVNGETLDIDFPPPGRFDAPRPALPEGVTRAHESVLVCAEFKSSLGEELAAYTRVHANAGVRVRVAKGRRAREPVTARYELGGGCPALVDNNVIFAEPHSEITVVLIYDGGDAPGLFHAGLTRVIAENCSVVRVAQLQTFGAGTRHFSDFSAVIANGARVELTRIELGAGETYAGCHMKLEGAGSEARADTFYLGGGDRKLDFNYVARHLGRATKSEMNASGALFGNCEKTYRGTIDFVAGAGESKGAESETTLLFSESSRNRSAPVILCGEENVEGSHAASVGRIDEGKLYYLRSRGLTEAEAKRLMTGALMETAMRNVPEGERERLRETLGERID